MKKEKIYSDLKNYQQLKEQIKVHLIENGMIHERSSMLGLSEVITILVYFHQI